MKPAEAMKILAPSLFFFLFILIGLPNSFLFLNALILEGIGYFKETGNMGLFAVGEISQSLSLYTLILFVLNLGLAVYLLVRGPKGVRGPILVLFGILLVPSILHPFLAGLFTSIFKSIFLLKVFEVLQPIALVILSATWFKRTLDVNKASGVDFKTVKSALFRGPVKSP